TGELQYAIRNPTHSRWDIFAADNIIHDAGLGDDGVIGRMVADIGRENVGLIHALENYAQTYFGNGGMPRLYLTRDIDAMPGKDVEVDRRLGESFDESHGRDRRNRTAVLPRGVKPFVVGQPNDANQLLESRMYSVRDACRWLNVPPHILFEFTDSKFNNLFEMASGYIKLSLAPLATALESELSFKLLSEAERANMFVYHVFEGLLRGDFE